MMAPTQTAPIRGGNDLMRKVIPVLIALALSALAAFAQDKDIKETDRLENSGEVMEEILNVPDDIPQDLLDKAECVVVFPSVLEAAFIGGCGGAKGTQRVRGYRRYPARGNSLLFALARIVRRRIAGRLDLASRQRC